MFYLHVVAVTLQLLVWCSLSGANPTAQRRPAPNSAPRADRAASMKQMTWNPPASMRADLDATWAWITRRRRDATTYRNWGWHDIMENGGYINYCIRWESTTVATPELRKLTGDTLNKQLNKWFALLAGFEGWPYPRVPMRIVGWAGRNRSLFPGLNETREGRYYSDKDREGIPQCSEACGRFFHRNGQYLNCPGGKAMHYDMSYWLTDKFGGGAGGDWGQRMQTAGSIKEMRKDGDFGTLLHEFAHTMALDDFYEWKPPGQKVFLMAGNGQQYITEFDAWMMRQWWVKLKPTFKSIPAPKGSGSGTRL